MSMHTCLQMQTSYKHASAQRGSVKVSPPVAAGHSIMLALTMRTWL